MIPFSELDYSRKVGHGAAVTAWTPIPGAHLGWTTCACGVPVVSVQSQADQAKCMECGRTEITWPWFTPEGSWHPTVGYSGPGAGPPWPGPWPGAPASPDPGPFPEPLVSSRDGIDPEVWPAACTQLRARMEGRGWTCLLQYAEGWMPHATHGRPGSAPRESVALRARWHGHGAVAVYRQQAKGWAWDLFYVWSAARPWTKLATLDEFEAATIGRLVRYPETLREFYARTLGPIVRYPDQREEAYAKWSA